jgi:hypothetical protein
LLLAWAEGQVTYYLEMLGDERFQKLCQAILSLEYPNVQCLPVGQPDGGRDATRRHRTSAGGAITIFQVKFSKNPDTRSAREAVAELIRTEKQKVDRLIERGATAYHFMTNVPGTAHLGTGSIDRLNDELTAAFGIDCFCWWRDDIERRIDGNSAIKWSYPEIMKATDILQSLTIPPNDPHSKRRSDAIRSYMTYQARHDPQLKFKQVDLQKDMIDLFVDVPAQLMAPAKHTRGVRLSLDEFEDRGFVDDRVLYEGDEAP